MQRLSLSPLGLGVALSSACAAHLEAEQAAESAPALANTEFRELAAADWELASGAEKYVCVRQVLAASIYVSAWRGITVNGTHHVLLTQSKAPDGLPDGVSECDAAAIGPQNIFGAGMESIDRHLPSGIAAKLAQGSQILLNLHLFNPTDQPLRGRSGVSAITVEDSAVHVTADTVSAGPIKLVIPPGRSTSHGTCTFKRDATIFSVAPHMHRVGIAMQVVAHTQSYGAFMPFDGPYLAAHPGRLIRKDELVERVWNAAALSDGALSNSVAKLRRALGQGARDREPIETVHGRGYRFQVRTQPTAAAPALRANPFVGRAAVLAQLADVLQCVEAGAGRLVVVSGEAGIGKSRLLAELCKLANGREFSAWQGLCYAGGVAPAYWPWIEILRSALADARLRRHLPSEGWAIASLIPELLAPSARPQDAELLRFQLFDELVRWLSAAASDTPRLIVLDDLQWADHSSVELLEHLARALARQRVLLAVALRLPAADTSDLAAQGLRRLLRSAVHVPLIGLSTPELTQLVAAQAAGQPEARVAELLQLKTQGNPFFVQQILQLLAQRGRTLSAAELTSSELPLAIREVIQQRLQGLPSETRALLRAAAGSGQTFEAALLARISQQPLAAVLAALEPALRLGVLRAAQQRFELTHALMCDALYAELSLEARGALHAALSHALAEQAASADARTLAELVRHDLLAVPFDPEAALAHARRAATAAREASGFEAAAEISERVLERLSLESGQGERRCELLYQLGFDRFCVGDIERGRRALEDAARLASEMGASRWLVRIVCRLSGWNEIGEFRHEVSQLVSQALAQVDRSEQAYALLLARHAQLNPQLGAAERSRLYEQAERLASAAGDPQLLQEIAMSRAYQRDPAQLTDMHAACIRYRALAEQHPHTELGIQRRLWNNAIDHTEYWCALIQGDLAAADLALAHCEASARECRVPHLEHLAALLRTTRAISDGRLLEAESCIERMREPGELSGALGKVWLFCQLLLMEAKGDHAALGQMIKPMDVSALDRLAPQHAPGALAWCARTAARLGQTALARAFLARAQSFEIARMPMTQGDLGVLCALADVYVLLDDPGCADALYAQLTPYAALNAVGIAMEYSGSVAHYLGRLALLRGEPSAALQHAQTALGFNQSLANPALTARSQELLAEARARCAQRSH